MNLTKTLLLTSVAVIAVGTAASAQSVTFEGDVISFGDSLSDNGNVFALSGGLAPGAPFPGNRFTTAGGLTAVEQPLGGEQDPTNVNAVSPQSVFFAGGGVTGDVNLAVGGAFAGTGNLGPLLPGVTEQIGAFAGAGGTISQEDTITYWAGANNFFAGLPTVGSAADAFALGQSVGGLAVNDIGTLTSGAFVPGGGPGQAIIFNLPDFALLPATVAGADSVAAGASAAVGAAGGDATAQATAAATARAGVLGAASLATDVYNTTLAAGVANLAATDTDTDFIQVDVASAFDAVIANPSAFGFANVSGACLLDATCAAADQATQNTFLFADGVHPTNAGHALVASLVAQSVNPDIGGDAVSGVADAPIAARQVVTGSALSRGRSFFTNTSGAGGGVTKGALSFDGQANTRRAAFFEAIAGLREIAARGTTPSVETSFGGVRFGTDFYQGDDLVVGVQGSFISGSGSQPGTTFDTESYGIDVYATKTFGQAFIAASVGAALIDISDVERSVGVGGLTNSSETDGSQYSAVLEVGYDIKRNGFSIIPSATLGYFRTELDGFTETGPFAPLQFSDRSIDAVTGAVNVKAVKNFDNGAGLQGFFSVGIGYEDYLSYSGDQTVSAIGSTATPTALTIDDPDGRGFVFDLAAKFDINETFSLTADYQYGTSGSSSESHIGSLGISYAF